WGVGCLSHLEWLFRDLTRCPGSFRRFAFQLMNSFFHLFAGLKGHYVLLGNKYLVAGARVAGLASRTLLHFEDTKVRQLNTLPFDQCLYDGIKRLLDDFFC